MHALFSPYEQQGDNAAINYALLSHGEKKGTQKIKGVKKDWHYSGICLDYFSPFKSTELLMLCYKKLSLTVKDYHLTKTMTQWNK